MTDQEIRELIEREVEGQFRAAMRGDNDLMDRIRAERSRQVLGGSGIQSRVERRISTR